MFTFFIINCRSFLAYFWQTFPLAKTKPNLWQWTGDWQKIDQIQPLVYQVNPFLGANQMSQILQFSHQDLTILKEETVL